MGVRVSDRMQTTNPNVYAVGDVASKCQFTHMSDFGARLVICNALFLGRNKFSDLLIPWATYKNPEVAHVGLYENDLSERGIEFTTITRDFDDVDRAIVDGRLYLNYNFEIQRKWEKDISGHIKKADANWPGVLK
jgi:pyruvate/2-oxoglutarate dehydrogenase complex dihydrolipoamide dehydrogenase (E3) component